jgi:hypothetical protein
VGVAPFELARIIGTSVAMIEPYLTKSVHQNVTTLV